MFIKKKKKGFVLPENVFEVNRHYMSKILEIFRTSLQVLPLTRKPYFMFFLFTQRKATPQ